MFCAVLLCFYVIWNLLGEICCSVIIILIIRWETSPFQCLNTKNQYAQWEKTIVQERSKRRSLAFWFVSKWRWWWHTKYGKYGCVVYLSEIKWQKLKKVCNAVVVSIHSVLRLDHLTAYWILHCVMVWCVCLSVRLSHDLCIWLCVLFG